MRLGIFPHTTLPRVPSFFCFSGNGCESKFSIEVSVDADREVEGCWSALVDRRFVLGVVDGAEGGEGWLIDADACKR